ncbi:MAG: hypothetical protein UR85_C0011G0008 [Candidatus Nomurabacteria bacterium GW2011_GWF2_35_66]|nr:MAG: hypothetical protein UR85_C0011G0008 [Candidatus Nomurabacteria bacterium GW2011_GWF2_35_66]HBM45414.1 hypothetical protein [Patescibacteria group bacterium]
MNKDKNNLNYHCERNEAVYMCRCKLHRPIQGFCNIFWIATGFRPRKDGRQTNMKKSGFTLIEALVAISILVISVIGPLSLASKGLSYSTYAKDEITAFYLANEAIDVIRNIRDTNTRSEKPWLDVPGDNMDIKITEKCKGPKGCYFDVWKNPPNLRTAFVTGDIDSTLKTCNSDSGLVRFGYAFDWPNSIIPNECADIKIDQTSFLRNITIDEVGWNPAGLPTEIRATVKVSWTTKTGIERSVTITENLFKLGVI